MLITLFLTSAMGFALLKLALSGQAAVPVGARGSRSSAAQLAAIAPIRTALPVSAAPGSGSGMVVTESRANLARVVLAWFRPIRLRCLLTGHDDYLSREPHRLFLRCGECGRCTSGWTIGLSPPRVTAPIARHTEARAALAAVRVAGLKSEPAGYFDTGIARVRERPRSRGTP